MSETGFFAHSLGGKKIGCTDDPIGPMCGFLILDKPPGMTSMQVVAAVRRRAGGKSVRVGHAGTLDPLATGLLIVAVGRAATRLIDQIQSLPKRYETTIDLSSFSTTDDREGELIDVDVSDPPTQSQVEDTLESQFTGGILQTPPAYSAVNIGGRRAYQLARAATARHECTGQALLLPGAAVEAALAPRMVTIHSIRALNYRWPMLSLAIECSKGTYIRRLARDLGRALGTGGHCVTLRRTATGPFSIDRALKLDSLPPALTQTDLLSIGDVLAMTASSVGGAEAG